MRQLLPFCIASILPERWNTGNSNLLSDLGLAIPYGRLELMQKTAAFAGFMQ